jgi:hypothetical protein
MEQGPPSEANIKSVPEGLLPLKGTDGQMLKQQ